MEGQMFRFGSTYDAGDRHLVGFVSVDSEHKTCKNVLILVPGLSDGFMSMAYTEYLSNELVKMDFSVVQVNLSSSFQQYGISSLKKDCQELTKLLAALKERYRFEKVIVLGHSTGAQDALYYMRYGEMASCVDGVVLQGAVSDREIIATFERTPHMLQEAKKLIAEGKHTTLLSERLEDAPITAERFLSLTGRLTDDDMFSTDLTEAELQPILSSVKVPILLCFSADDQYVPDKTAQKDFAQRMVAVLRKSCQVECQYLPGEHGLAKPEHYQPFVNAVCQFLVSYVVGGSKAP